jgi:hypothetical protein
MVPLSGSIWPDSTFKAKIGSMHLQCLPFLLLNLNLRLSSEKLCHFSDIYMNCDALMFLLETGGGGLCGPPIMLILRCGPIFK